VSFAGSLIVLLLLTPNEEARFFDKALSTGSFAVPSSWPRLLALMKIAERWQRFSVSSSQKARRVFWRLDIVSWASNSCKAASDRIVKGYSRGQTRQKIGQAG